MIYLFLLMVFNTSFHNYFQKEPQLECNKLVKAVDYEIIKGGLIDHSELDINWIEEEILIDSAHNWIESYLMKNWFDNWEMTEQNKKHIKNEIQYARSQLEMLLKKAKDGDRLFYYTTPDAYWQSLGGQDGVVLVRNCTAVGVSILTQS